MNEIESLEKFGWWSRRRAEKIAQIRYKRREHKEFFGGYGDYLGEGFADQKYLIRVYVRKDGFFVVCRGYDNGYWKNLLAIRSESVVKDLIFDTWLSDRAVKKIDGRYRNVVLRERRARSAEEVAEMVA
jgi:hypothetical protein